MSSILNKEKILEQARLFVEEGRFDKAIKEYEKILLADPADMRVKLRIAELHVKRKQVADAIRVYREVAGAYTQEGFYLKAVTVYKNILRLNPSLIEINEYLADLYNKMGLLNDAVRQYDIYASALEQKGDLDKVMELRRRIVELTPEDGSARVRLAELYQREGRGEEAIDQYEEYARRLEQSGGDEMRLIEMYEKVLSYRSGREEMLRALIRIYYGKDEIKKALKWLEFAKTLTPIDEELLAMQAEIYARLNQMETSRSKYLALSDLCREHENVEGAADALARIAMIIPSEEERVERRAHEIGDEALARFRTTLEALREKEKREGEEEELTDKAEAPQPKPKPKPKPEPKPQPQPKTEPQPKTKPKVQPKAKATPKPKAKAQPEPDADWDKTIIVPVETTKAQPKPRPEVASKTAPKQPAVSQREDVPTVQEAKAAYNLAILYDKIGLANEAKKELEKAARLYEQLAKSSPDAAEVYAEIQKKLK